jgi:hypothetical protein
MDAKPRFEVELPVAINASLAKSLHALNNIAQFLWFRVFPPDFRTT